MGDDVTRRLSTIVAGYSRLMGADEEGTVAALKLCRETLVDPAIADGGGRIVSAAGDGLLIEFASVVAALRCCIAIQHEMAARYRDVPLERRLRFRMAINIVDVIVDGMDVFGDGVNMAARLEGVADPGGICVSRAVVDQAMADVYFATLGERSLKNIYPISLEIRESPCNRFLDRFFFGCDSRWISERQGTHGLAGGDAASE